MRIGRLDTPADLLELGPDLQPQMIEWLWVGVLAKDSADAPQAASLRSPAKVEVRSWWDSELLQGRYLRAESRLFHIDSVRDVTGQQAELTITATELIGAAAIYTPAGGDPVACRVLLTHGAPYLDELGQVTDYRTRVEVALIEVGRPQVDDQLQVGVTLYTVIAYADDSDDGVVRGLWLEAL